MIFPPFLFSLVKCLEGGCGIYVNEIWGKELHGYDSDFNAKSLKMPRAEASHSQQRQMTWH